MANNVVQSSERSGTRGIIKRLVCKASLEETEERESSVTKGGEPTRVRLRGPAIHRLLRRLLSHRERAALRMAIASV